MGEHHTEIRLSREMRLLDVTMIGVGAMIGAGIFVLTGIAAGVAGPALLMVFVLNGFVALLTAMAYAELGSAIHDAGGGYLWVKASLPDPSGFLSGWMGWFAHAVACSLYALGFGAYFKEVLSVAGIAAPVPPFGRLEIWLAVIACAIFAYINYRGASEAGKAGNIVTIGKVAIIGVFIAAGLWAMVHRPGWRGAFTPFMSTGWGGILAAMGLTFIAFEGYEIIAQTSEEVEDPKRNVPRAVFLSLLIVIPIYVLVALVAIGAVTPPAGIRITDYLGQEKEIALVAAANQFMLGGGILILVGGLLSTISALNATIYSSSRVAFAMARDSSLPALVARVHSKRSTPHFAILFSTSLIMFMAIALPIEDVAAAAGVMFLLLFGGVNVALIRLRRLRPELDRGFKVPFVPFTPILAIVTMLFVAVFMFFQYPMAWVAAGGWIVAGLVLHRFYAAPKEAEAIAQAERVARIERKNYRVLVALSSPHTARSLVELGTAIARQHGGEIICLSVVEVPEGRALEAGRDETGRSETLLAEAVEAAREASLTARGVIKITHRVSHGIAETVREEECNFLVIGRKPHPSPVEWLFAAALDEMIATLPCDVAVVSGQLHRGGISRVVVPVDDSRNARLACELAPALASWCEATIRPMSVVRLSPDAKVAAERREATERLVAEAGIAVRPAAIEHDDVAAAILGFTTPGDILLLGSSTSGPFADALVASVPGQLVATAQVPTVIVRKYQPSSGGWLRRLASLR